MTRPRYEGEWIPTSSLVIAGLVVLAILLDTVVAIWWIVDKVRGG